MKRAFVFLLFFTYIANAQTVRWATRVIGVSSEYATGTGQQHKVSQVLGRPSVLASGSSTTAWRPAQADAPEEWIQVAFDTAMVVKQVAIAENMGAGCVTKIVGYSEKNQEIGLWENPNETGKKYGTVLNIKVRSVGQKISALKIFLNTSKIANWNEIDAIGISGGEQPIEATINVAPDIPVLVRENLGPKVNSAASEVAPIISPDGQTIYFTRYNHPQNSKTTEDFDVWYARQQNGLWQEAQSMGAPVNNAEPNSITYISPDERNALLMNIYEPNGTLRQGLSMSTRTGQVWGFPKEVKIKNYYNKIDVSAFTMSPNGKIMVLSLENQNSLGGTDLYLSFLQKDGTWSEPLNMGSDLNTPETEGTPFVSADTKTLYFSTNGRAGFGATDVFLSHRLDDTWLRWSEPQNVGNGINTIGYDAHFTIPASGAWAYFCSEDRSLGSFDIFRLKLPLSLRPEPAAILTGQVLDQKTKQPIAAEVIFERLDKTADPDAVAYDPASGVFKVVLPIAKIYGVSATKQGYQALSDTIDLRKERSYREITKDLYMIPLDVGQTVLLNNVFFEQSEYRLLPSSFAELNRVAQLMADSPSMEIQIEGHTDNQGDFDANIRLSQQRVEAVKEYLTQKGVASARVRVKGWGSTRVLYNTPNEAKRKLNRRVEFTVLKK